MAFLSVACKSFIDVDLETPVKKFIEKVYGQSTVQEISGALEKLQDLRKNALARLRDRTIAAADLVARYHDTLALLESRVPMSATEVRIDWKWPDITGKQKKVCTSAFERANLIFCYGAIHSQIAESAGVKDLKQAVLSLKLAASAFDYLTVNSLMLGVAANDLTIDHVAACSLVMQAQAQECLFIKGEQTPTLPASNLLAGVASKTRECYEEAWKKCSTHSLKAYFPKEWLNNLWTKMQLYAVLAHYYQSKVCEEKRVGGERVGRLAAAYELLKSIRSNSAFTRNDLRNLIKKEHETATKENEILFHETVPSVKELAPIPPKGAINKPELIFPLSKSELKDPFTCLVPVGVLEAKSQAQIIYRSLIAAEIHRLGEATNSLNAVMLSLNLPAAIQLGSPNDCYSSLLEGAARVRELGGADRLSERVYSLPSSVTRNRDILNELLHKLDEEEKTDENLRKQFGDRWIRQPSRKLTGTFRDNLATMTKLVAQAEEADANVTGRYRDHAESFELLSQSDSEILTAIRSEKVVSTASPTGGENARQALAQVCSQIEALKADRHSLVDQLDTMNLPDNVVTALIELYKQSNDGRITEQQLLDILNIELEGTRGCVRASEKKQAELLSELQTKHQTCFGSVGSSDASNLSTRLTAALDEFFKLDSDVNKGICFYTELTERCFKLNEVIDDFVLARTTEKTEYLADITSELGRVTIAETPSVPTPINTTVAPSRPPQTYASLSTPSAPAPPSTVTPISTTEQPAVANVASAGAPVQPGFPPPTYAHPGMGWTSQPFPYGSAQLPYPPYGYPAYPPVGGMYSFYPGYSVPPQMPPMPSFPMMPGQPGSYGPYQPQEPPR